MRATEVYAAPPVARTLFSRCCLSSSVSMRASCTERTHALDQASCHRSLPQNTHLHPCSIRPLCCSRLVMSMFTFPLHRLPRNRRRRFRDPCRRLHTRKAPLRRDVRGLAPWPTCTSSQVMSPSMTSTTTRRSRR